MFATKKYAIGLDYGTNSCRALIVDLTNGVETASHLFAYPSGEQGVLVDSRDPNVARQNPADYLLGLEEAVVGAIAKARSTDATFQPELVVGIGVDTTGSTPMPVDRSGTPLALLPQFENNLTAQAWLWKDHTSYAEAAEITKLAAEIRPHYLKKCGGAYSSEWFWAKILHLLRSEPQVFEAAFSFVELCDWLPAVLTGCQDPMQLKRSACVAGHKAIYSQSWGGLPDSEFLQHLDPALAALRTRLYTETHTANTPAGTLCEQWATKLGLPPTTVVAVGALDAHIGAVGAGCGVGKVAKILGTSSCDLLVAPTGESLPDIPGVCGMADGSVLPGYIGIEAGQAAVGDIFLWFVNNFAPDGATQAAQFALLDSAAAQLKPGASGLLALDWNNGNRSILTDVRLSGVLLGQTLHTTPTAVYRALIEATAFGAKVILERVRQYAVPVEQIITCGGLAIKNPLLLQIYADVLGMPIFVAASQETCALGAALFGAVAAGAFASVEEAQQKLCRVKEEVYRPIAANTPIYAQLYHLYRQLHDAFGLADASGNLANVMKELLSLREQQRA